ncbi:MAG: hypothetical protein KGD58_02260 [Candidatus Lokiarchaeota archaeon]|nr:hypothetical protein [Candidatus Lokiarchaeota archaeon]
MIKNSFHLFQIGKELGLTKKEIKNLSLFGNTKHPFLYTIVMIVSIVAFGILIIFLGIQAFRKIYPSGTLYSTVKKEDFKRNKQI